MFVALHLCTVSVWISKATDGRSDEVDAVGIAHCSEGNSEEFSHDQTIPIVGF